MIPHSDSFPVGDDCLIDAPEFTQRITLQCMADGLTGIPFECAQELCQRLLVLILLQQCLPDIQWGLGAVRIDLHFPFKECNTVAPVARLLVCKYSACRCHHDGQRSHQPGAMQHGTENGPGEKHQREQPADIG